MRVVVTCGPSYEPIDEVRRLTNFSTGELGVLLANVLAGHEVICCKGVAATTPLVVAKATTVPFTTNDDLLAKLTALPDRETIGAVFHAAALSDLKVKSVRDATGQEIRHAKLPSAGALTIALEPAPKLLAGFRELFPRALIVGWKYEMNGTQDDAIARARQQLDHYRLDACVLNGAAYAPGFGFYTRTAAQHFENKPALVTFLARWIATVS